MEYQGLFILIFPITLFLWITFFTLNANKGYKAARKNIDKICEALTQSGFIISRKIGLNVKKFRVQGYFLFIDDVNKRWLLTSPYHSEIARIRSFSDLIDYEFFDEDGSNMMGKILKGMVGTMTAIGGVALGGLVGGVLGGAGGAKASKILPGGKGDSKSYGFAVLTTDCDANNPIWVYDFVSVALESMDSSIAVKITNKLVNKTKTGVERRSKYYKSEIAAIQEMASVFDYIIASNARQQ